MYEAAQEISYLDCVIQESLRLFSPGARSVNPPATFAFYLLYLFPSHICPLSAHFPFLLLCTLASNLPYLFLPHPIFHCAISATRLCTKEVCIGGVTVPEDAVVVIPFDIIHHDPKLWPDPETFRPKR